VNERQLDKNAARRLAIIRHAREVTGNVALTGVAHHRVHARCPAPLRSAVIQLTCNRLAAADRREGRRGMWLRALDRLGLGSTAEATAAGSAAKLAVTGGAPRTGDVTAGGGNRN